MLNCEYCGKAFNPARRFVQKFCSTSCRVLFKRHQGNRANYETKKNQILPKISQDPPAKLRETSVNEPILSQELIKQQDLTNVYPLIRVFYEEYLGKEVSPSEVTAMPLLQEIIELKLSALSNIEKEIVGHIRRILQSIERCEYKNSQQKFRIKMKPEALNQLEMYLKMKNS
jgi:hypothetical protein